MQELTSKDGSGDEHKEVEEGQEEEENMEGKDGTEQEQTKQAPAASTHETPAENTVEEKETPEDKPNGDHPEEEPPKKKRRQRKSKAPAATAEGIPDVKNGDEQAKKGNKTSDKVSPSKQVVESTASSSKEAAPKTKQNRGGKKANKESAKEKAKASEPSEPEEPEATAKAKAQAAKAKTKAKAKAKAKVQVEKGGGAKETKENKEKETDEQQETPKETNPAKRQKTETLCFARRRCPTTEAGKLKWNTLKKVFQEQIKPKLTKFSSHEDRKKTMMKPKSFNVLLHVFLISVLGLWFFCHPKLFKGFCQKRCCFSKCSSKKKNKPALFF